MKEKTKKPKRIPEDPGEVKLYVRYPLENNLNGMGFNGKAWVMFGDDGKSEITAHLISYESAIASCNRFGIVEKAPGYERLSMTSGRHFRAFQSQAKDLAHLICEVMKMRFGEQSLAI